MDTFAVYVYTYTYVYTCLLYESLQIRVCMHHSQELIFIQFNSLIFWSQFSWGSSWPWIYKIAYFNLEFVILLLPLQSSEIKWMWHQSQLASLYICIVIYIILHLYYYLNLPNLFEMINLAYRGVCKGVYACACLFSCACICMCICILSVGMYICMTALMCMYMCMYEKCMYYLCVKACVYLEALVHMCMNEHCICMPLCVYLYACVSILCGIF